MIKKTFSSGYPFEDVYSYARAVRVGDHVVVSGTTARPPHLDGDAYQHITSAIATVAKALGEAGAELRTLPACAGRHLGGSRPASTLVQVAALTPDQAPGGNRGDRRDSRLISLARLRRSASDRWSRCHA